MSNYIYIIAFLGAFAISAGKTTDAAVPEGEEFAAFRAFPVAGDHLFSVPDVGFQNPRDAAFHIGKVRILLELGNNELQRRSVAERHRDEPRKRSVR